MANGINELMDELYTTITDAWGFPLGVEKCIIERDKVLELLDEIKSQLPAEISEAQRLMAARAEYINAAKAEADKLRSDAEEYAKRLVEEQTVVQAAKVRAEEIIGTADGRAGELRRAANAYADETMRRAEETLARALNELQSSRASFRSAAANTNGGKAE